MNLSNIQNTALFEIVRWLRGETDHENQSFTLAGFAGSGKTTLMKAVIEAAREMGVSPACCTPTGKAAARLAEKIGDLAEVSTLHSFLYQPVDVTELDVDIAKKDAEEMEKRGLDATDAWKRHAKLDKLMEDGGCEFGNRAEPKWAPLVIVDECSMVGDKIEKDLRYCAAKILFVGDPAQLPPVEGRDFFERNRPDFTLDEVHRQAEGSAILQLATFIRTGGLTSGEKFGGWNSTDCVLVKGCVDVEELAAADQVITGMNKTRRALNQKIRKALGFTADFPELGERVICLQNNHGKKLINGVPGTVAKAMEEDTFGELVMDLSYEGHLFKGLAVDPLAFAQYANQKLTRRDLPKCGKDEFDFGHAITVHKSQGSEWDHVVVVDDKMRRNDLAARARWIYTAATRAAVKLTWANGY